MMKDKHVHFHIIPRYSKKINFAGIEWIDNDWPKKPADLGKEIPQEVLNQIKEEIIKNM